MNALPQAIRTPARAVPVFVLILFLLSAAFYQFAAGPAGFGQDTHVPTHEGERGGYPQVVLFGDSLTERSFDKGGYGTALVARYAAKMDVLNRGFGGYNSRQLLSKMQEIYPSWYRDRNGGVKLFIVHIGTNDAAMNEQQHVEPDEYKKNLWAILSHLTSTHPTSRIVCLTPSSLAEDQWANHMSVMNKLKPHEGAGSLNEALEGPQSDRTVKQNHLYAGLVKNIVREWNQINTQPKPVDGTGEEAQEKAKRRRVGLVDCFRVLAIAKGQDGISNNLLFTDGLHWTERAYAVSRHVVQNDNYNANPLLCVPVLDPPLDEQYVTKELERVLASIAPELDPGALPFAFDAWQEYLQGQ